MRFLQNGNYKNSDFDLIDQFLFGDNCLRKGIMKTDINEDNDNYYFQVEVPGFKKEEININIEEGNLTISIAKEEEKEEKDYLRKERVYSSCERTFYVGEVKEDEIEAKLEDGVLNITVPKNVEVPKTKVIQIK